MTDSEKKENDIEDLEKGKIENEEETDSEKSESSSSEDSSSSSSDDDKKNKKIRLKRWKDVAKGIVKKEKIKKCGLDENFTILHKKSTYLASCSNYKANVYRIFHIIFNFIIIISGVTIGTSYFTTDSTEFFILGYLVSISKIIDELLNLGNAALLFKNMSTRCQKISRKIREIKISSVPDEEKIIKIEKFFDELDDIELLLFHCGLNHQQ